MSLLPTFSESLESGMRKFLPYSLMGLLLLLGSVPMPLLMNGDVKAPLFLMGLYYWSVFRPTLMPPWLAFAAGMMADLIGGLPLGLSACIFVLVQWIVSDQRRFLMGQSFVMIWFGFFIVMILTGCLQWLIFGLVNMNWPPLQPLVFSVLLGLVFFPPVCVALHWTHKILKT